MNQDVNENRKLILERGKANGEIKDGHRKLALEEVAVYMIWKEYFDDLYNIDTQEQDAVHVYGFDEVQRSKLL